MMATTHAIIGTAIAASIKNPWEAGALIITSHYLLDLIPHWDFGTDWKARSKGKTGILAIIDTLLGFGIAFLLFGTTVPGLTIFWATSLSNFPDWIEAPYFLFFASKEGHHKARGGTIGLWIGKIHKFQEDYIHTTARFAQGVTTQIAAIVFFFYLLKRS